MNTNEELRDVYSKCYSNESYRMGHPRRQKMIGAVSEAMQHLRAKGSQHTNGGFSIADVGCGRGELLRDVVKLHPFRIACGFEIVPELCGRFDGYEVIQIDSIGKFPRERQFKQNDQVKWGKFDVVTCSDVLEHILPEETGAALQALWDMTASTLILHVAWFSHVWNMPDGSRQELHINKRQHEEWAGLVWDCLGSPPRVDADVNAGTALIVARR